MNYESKRSELRYTDEQKTKQKVKNFKLKFSRMTTCFASIASICSYKIPIKEEHIIEQISLTPHERLKSIANRIPETNDAVQDVIDKYAFFLDKTGLPIEKLENHFADKEKRTEMFRIAEGYGDSMYQLLKNLDSIQENNFKFLRYLVI